MKKMRTVKVKAGQEKLRERIKDALAQKGARAHIRRQQGGGLEVRGARRDCP